MQVAFATFGAVSGWYFVRNKLHYDKAILTGFDGVDPAPAADREGKSYLDRRTLGFFVGWSNQIFQYPYYPAADWRFAKQSIPRRRKIPPTK